jgi:hypothetical protein|nr:MAG TPA: hypothetical protein [Caudoviricetes sp.]DAR72248.1 MAG TPA: hypothetical protein [Caudoviricetes sp.]
MVDLHEHRSNSESFYNLRVSEERTQGSTATRRYVKPLAFFIYNFRKMPKIVVNRGKLPDLIISRSLAQLAQKKDIHRNTASAMFERGEIIAVKTKIGK